MIKYENEITVEINTTFDKLNEILINNDFVKKAEIELMEYLNK